MRDIFVTLVVFGSLPFILRQPYLGVLVWSWLGYMNPHRLGWSFATEMPYAQIVALTTLFAMMISREAKRIPWTRETIILLIFILWMVLTTIFAIHQQAAFEQLDKVLKIQLMTFVTMMLMKRPERVNLLVWVIVLSLGFYGVKGGIFTLLTGGGYHVRGPYGSFISGNNEIGLALIMTLPLMRYLQLQSGKFWMRRGWAVAILLTVVAILGTQSRGALVGISAMTLFLILKSRNRFLLLLFVLAMIPATYLIMPESWFERMHSIQTYEEDSSVQGRFRAWNYALKSASSHFFGGGYEMFRGHTDAHSIYFEILGEHGFIGLIIFLLLGLFTWRTGSWIIQQTRQRDELAWCRDLASMVQVSMVGFAVAGAFLGLAYFDLYYHLIAIMVICRTMVMEINIKEHNKGDNSPGFLLYERFGATGKKTFW